MSATTCENLVKLGLSPFFSREASLLCIKRKKPSRLISRGLFFCLILEANNTRITGVKASDHLTSQSLGFKTPSYQPVLNFYYLTSQSL